MTCHSAIVERMTFTQTFWRTACIAPCVRMTAQFSASFRHRYPIPLVGALLEGRDLHTLEPKQIRETVALAVKVVAEIEEQCTPKAH